MPRVDDPRHKKYEQDITELFCHYGYLVGNLTYHDHVKEEIKNALSLLDTPTTQSIRTRADRFSIYPGEHCIKWEVKTASRPTHDMLVELYPFMHHVQEEKLGVECLYFWDSGDHRVGCTIQEMRKSMEVIFITNRTQEWEKILISKLFDDIYVQSIARTFGSNDAFFKIPRDVAIGFRDYKELIENNLTEKLRKE